ncbi:MAG: hypothetical protein ACOC4M_14615 [Promethearchaeia archaeon]
MNNSVQDVLDSIQDNWDKRQSWFWRLKNKIVYNFMRNIYKKNVPKTIPDPSIDEESEHYSYFTHPNMQLGLPNEERAARVDDDGQIDTSHGKFILFRGCPIKKIDKRIWTLSDGYLPEINYSLQKFNIKYSIKVFQYWINGKEKNYPCNFVEVTAQNLIDETVNDDLYIGVLFNPFKHKLFGYNRDRFKKRWRYEFDKHNNYPVRDGRILYFHGEESPINLYAKLNYDNSTNTYEPIPYEGRFKGNKYDIKPDSITLIQQFKFHITPKGVKTFIFKIPQDPVDIENKKLIKKIGQIKINKVRRRFQEFWDGIIDGCTEIALPEPKVTNASKASLIFNFMCQNFHEDGTMEQHVNRFQYNDFWIRDSAFFAKMYSCFNQPSVAKKLLSYFLNKQTKKGNFISQKGQLDGWGQSLWAFGEYLKYKRDKEFAETIFAPLMNAIDFFEDTIKQDEWGILPPVSAADNEMISGRYTGHNFWAWCGLNNAQYIAEFLKNNEEAKRIASLKSRFLDSFLPILDLIAEKHNNRIPPGLDTDLGEDWSNLLMLYPQMLLGKDDSKVKETLEVYRNEKMPEHIATWMVFNHHYITERIAQQHLVLDDQKKALHDFYGMLSHTGACHEGFEHNIKPWGNRHYLISIKILFWQMDYSNFPPHGWFAVAYNLLLRNMLVREEDNNLHLFSAVSPEWIEGPIKISNANTYFGVCNIDLSKKQEDTIISFSSLFNKKKPANIIIHIPYYIEKDSIKVTSGKEFTFNDERTAILIPAYNEFSITLNWRRQKDADLSYLSYQKSIEWLKKQYRKRYEEQLDQN